MFTPDSGAIKISDACDVWLAKGERDGLEPTTLTQYHSHAKYHIRPLLGNVRVSRLTRPRVEEFVDQMLDGGRSRVLTKKVLASLVSALNEAQRLGKVAQNVAKGVKVTMASRHKGKLVPPTPEQVKAALDAARGRNRVMLTVATFTGMRASEIRGLPWQHVDFRAKVIRVRQRASTSGKIGALKSASGYRDIPVPPLLANTLREWKLASPKSGPDDLVFPGRDGRPLCHNTVMSLLGGRAHPFRHFYASWLIDQNLGAKRVQYLMGHSSIQVTFDIYGHLVPAENYHERLAAAELALVDDVSSRTEQEVVAGGLHNPSDVDRARLAQADPERQLAGLETCLGVIADRALGVFQRSSSSARR